MTAIKPLTFDEIRKQNNLQEVADESPLFDIQKTDSDKRLVFGWANIAFTTDGEQLVDLQEDIIDTEDLEEAVYKYVLEFRDGGEEHIPTMRKKASLVESVMFTKEKMKAMGIPEGIVPEGWWIGFYVKDDDAWQRVKDGTYQMFSIEGKAIRVPVPDELEKADRVNGCGVLVVKDDKILTGTRIGGKHGNQICGPGGHIEAGESHEEASIREAFEEFGIQCKNLEPLGILDGGRNYGKSAIFLCTDFEGEPKTDEEEMTDCKWRTIEELQEAKLFKPFEQSLELITEEVEKNYDEFPSYDMWLEENLDATIEEQKEAKEYYKKNVAKTFADIIQKFNPHHDSKGRFASGGGAGSLKISYNELENRILNKPTMAASYLMNNGVPFDEVNEAYNNGTVTQRAKKLIDQKYGELQKRYDEATPGQKKLMQMTPEEVAELERASQGAEIPGNLNTSSTTQRVVHQLGMNEKPTVLSREEYEEVVKESPSGRIYRGVHSNSNVGVTADEIAEMTVNGDQTFLGNGIHSDGIYFSTKAETASHFTGQNGTAMEGCISPKARVIDVDELSLEKTKDPQGYTINDMGVYALHKGYNALKVKAMSDEDFYIALDRTALIFPKDYKVTVEPEPPMYVTLMNKSKKEINGEELGKIFNAFAFENPSSNTKMAKSFSDIIQKFNPFHDAKGRFSNSNGFATYSANPKTKAGAMAIDRSAKAGHVDTMNVHRESQGENIGQNHRWLQGGPGAKALAAQGQLASQQAKKPAPQKPTQTAQQTAQPQKQPPKPQKNYDKLGYADHDDADFHQLYNGRQYYQQQKLTSSQLLATKNYLEAHTESHRPHPYNLYSHSQNMNYQMATGQKLTGKYKQTHDELMSSMHNLGYNLKLTRYDHDGFVNGLLKSAGAGDNYQKLTQTQLKKALVGKTISEDKFLSASYNDFSKAPLSSKQVFNSRAVKIVYKAKANVQGMMPGVGPGGDLGEIILAPTNGKANNPGRITNVRFTGQKARGKGTQSYTMKQIEIEIELD